MPALCASTDVRRSCHAIVAGLLAVLPLLALAHGCSALSTAGDRITDEYGNTVTLKGASWFGELQGGKGLSRKPMHLSC